MRILDEYQQFVWDVERGRLKTAEELAGLNAQMAALQERVVVLTEARDLMIAVTTLTQNRIQSAINELVTMGIVSVFGPEYAFELTERALYNRSESYPTVIRAGVRHVLRDDEIGGSMIDVVALCLRVVLWALEWPRTDNVILLDEPLRWLDRSGHLRACGEMIRHLAQSLSLQFLIITHTYLDEVADRVFEVVMQDGISKVVCRK